MPEQPLSLSCLNPAFIPLKKHQGVSCKCREPEDNYPQHTRLSFFTCVILIHLRGGSHDSAPPCLRKNFQKMKAANTQSAFEATNPTLYLLFFFFSFLLSFSRSLLANSMTSLASFSGARWAGEKEPGPPYSVERVEARDRLFLRFSLTASLSRSLALRKE